MVYILYEYWVTVTFFLCTFRDHTLPSCMSHQLCILIKESYFKWFFLSACADYLSVIKWSLSSSQVQCWPQILLHRHECVKPFSSTAQFWMCSGPCDGEWIQLCTTLPLYTSWLHETLIKANYALNILYISLPFSSKKPFKKNYVLRNWTPICSTFVCCFFFSHPCHCT